jgi:hypothetical protein
MTKTQTATRTDADDALSIKRQEARELVQKMAKRIDMSPRRGAHWGHVGDMQYIIEQLRDALNGFEG